MNTKITLEIELTERQAEKLPQNIAELLRIACDNKIGELLVYVSNQHKDSRQEGH